MKVPAPDLNVFIRCGYARINCSRDQRSELKISLKNHNLELFLTAKLRVWNMLSKSSDRLCSTIDKQPSRIATRWNRTSDSATASTLLLNRRALHRAEGAEHTAVTGVRPEKRPAVAALVEELAGVCRHGLGFRASASRAGNQRFKHDGVHGRRHFCKVDGYPAFVVAAVRSSDFALSAS